MTPAEWLSQQKNVSRSLPITMAAMGQVWFGAVYTASNKGYEEQSIYLVGEMPKGATKLCFRFEDDDRDWYVTCYYQEGLAVLEPHQLKYHPFGKSWILRPWNIQETIDHYENKKYMRIPARLT
jgi:hypothetical protein